MNIENKSGDAVITVTEPQTNSKFYYGWVIVILGALSVTMSTGVIIGVLPHLYKSLTQEFGWTRTTISIAGSIALYTRAATGFYTGRLLDRYGVKRFIAPALVTLGLSLLLGVFVRLPIHFYAIIFILGLCVTLCGLGPCFYLASIWFNKKRGLAMSIVGMGASLGGAVFSPITANLVVKYGWRISLSIFGLFSIFVFTPFIHFLIKDRPSANDDPSYTAETKPEATATLKYESTESSADKLWQSGFLWMLVAGTALSYVPIFSVPQHLPMHLQSAHIGFSTIQAGWALSLLFASAFIGRFLFGYLCDRFNKRVINVLCSLVFLAAMIVLINLTNQTVWLFCSLFGFGYSGMSITGKLVLAERFGMKSLGNLLGIMMGVETILGGFGILLMGRVFDTTKSYNIAFMVMAGCIFAATILLALLLVKPVGKVSM